MPYVPEPVPQYVEVSMRVELDQVQRTLLAIAADLWDGADENDLPAGDLPEYMRAHVELIADYWRPSSVDDHDQWKDAIGDALRTLVLTRTAQARGTATAVSRPNTEED